MGEAGRLDSPGGVYLRKASHMSAEDHVLLKTAARCVFFGSRGGLNAQVERQERTLRPLDEIPDSELRPVTARYLDQSRAGTLPGLG